MTKEDYEELFDCLVFLQLCLYDRLGTLTNEGFFTLTGMKFDGWNEKKTDKTIKKFIKKYGGDDNED